MRFFVSVIFSFLVSLFVSAQGFKVAMDSLLCDELFTDSDVSVSVYDLDTKLEKVVWNYSADGFTNVGDVSYVGGRLYMIAKVPAGNAETVFDQYKKVEYAKNTFLVSVDISTGEWSKVTEEPVESYTLTDDRVYYFPSEVRHLYVPENYEKRLEDICVSFIDATLYSRKLDGSDLKTECTIGSLNTCYDFTVLDGKLYGSVSVYNESDESRDAAFCAVDLRTGAILDSDVAKK